jgi:hypothetical protein
VSLEIYIYVSISSNHKCCIEGGLINFNYKRNLAFRIILAFFPSLVANVLRHNHLVEPGVEGWKVTSQKTPWNTSEVAKRAWRGRKMDFARVASVALNMKATFPMRSELMKFPPLRTCAGKTLLMLAILYVLMRTISMFLMPMYPALNQPDCEAQLEFEFWHNWTRPVNHVWK